MSSLHAGFLEEEEEAAEKAQAAGSAKKVADAEEEGAEATVEDDDARKDNEGEQEEDVLDDDEEEAAAAAMEEEECGASTYNDTGNPAIAFTGRVRVAGQTDIADRAGDEEEEEEEDEGESSDTDGDKAPPPRVTTRSMGQVESQFYGDRADLGYLYSPDDEDALVEVREVKWIGSRWKKEMGLFANKFIPSGTKITPYAGPSKFVVPHAVAIEDSSHYYTIDKYADGSFRVIDGRNYP